MKYWPAGSYLVLEADIDETKVFCCGYKYSKKKVLTFVFNQGAAHTKAGKPYLAKWKDAFGASRVKYVYRPGFASDYFETSNRVDSHNHLRQNVLKLEKVWVTRCGWFRLHTTILGIDVVDTFKTYVHHLTPHHRHSGLTLLKFVGFLANDLIKSKRSKEVLLKTDTFSIEANGVLVLHEGSVADSEPLTQDSALMDVESEDEDDEDGGDLPAGFYIEANHVLKEIDETIVESTMKKVVGKDGTVKRKMYQSLRKRRGRCIYCGRKTSWFCPICPIQNGSMRHWCCNCNGDADESNDSSGGMVTRAGAFLSCAQEHMVAFSS